MLYNFFILIDRLLYVLIQWHCHGAKLKEFSKKFPKSTGDILGHLNPFIFDDSFRVWNFSASIEWDRGSEAVVCKREQAKS